MTTASKPSALARFSTILLAARLPARKSTSLACPEQRIGHDDEADLVDSFNDGAVGCPAVDLLSCTRGLPDGESRKIPFTEWVQSMRIFPVKAPGSASTADCADDHALPAQTISALSQPRDYRTPWRIDGAPDACHPLGFEHRKRLCDHTDPAFSKRSFRPFQHPLSRYS